RSRVSSVALAAQTLSAASLCARCDIELAPSLLSCPSCQSLVHADALRRLAAQADEADAAGQHADALSAWREALTLLPPEAQQHRLVSEKVDRLSRQVDTTPAPARAPHRGRAAGVGAIGVLVWKLKAVLLVLLTKGKLLMLGLTKLTTLMSMLLTLGVYWELWG